MMRVHASIEPYDGPVDVSFRVRTPNPAQQLVPAEVFPLHSWRIDIFTKDANRTEAASGEYISDLPTHPVKLEVIPVRAPPLADVDVRIVIGLRPMSTATAIIIYAPDGMAFNDRCTQPHVRIRSCRLLDESTARLEIAENPDSRLARTGELE